MKRYLCDIVLVFEVKTWPILVCDGLLSMSGVKQPLVNYIVYQLRGMKFVDRVCILNKCLYVG